VRATDRRIPEVKDWERGEQSLLRGGNWERNG